MAGDNELVIRVIGDDAQYTAVMNKVQRTIEKASGATRQFGHASRSSYIETSAAIRLMNGDMTNMIRACEAMVSRSRVLSAVFKTAFPVVGILAVTSIAVQGIERVVKKIEELRNASAEITRAMDNVQSNISDGARSMSEKLLAAEGRIDDLTDNHLAALQTQLERINDQSLDTIIGQLKELGSVANTAFKALTTPWYMPGNGSAGASSDWTTFSTQYHLLMSQGKTKQANDRLQGDLNRALKAQALQRRILAMPEQTMTAQGLAPNYERGKLQDLLKHNYGGLTVKPNDVNSENTLVSLLQALQSRGTTAGTIKADQKKAAKLEAKQAAQEVAERAAQAAQRILDANTKSIFGGRSHLIADIKKKLAEKAKQAAQAAQRVSDEQAHTVSSMQTDSYRGMQPLFGVKSPDQNKVAEASLRIEQMTGRVSALAAAQMLTSIHAREFADAMADLDRKLKAVNADRTLTEAERGRQVASIRNSRNSLITDRQIQRIDDRQAQYGNTLGGASRDAINQMVQSWTDMTAQLKDIIPESLNRVNASLAQSLTARAYTSQEYRRNIVQGLSNTTRGIGSSILQKGMQGIEGSVLGKFGYGKPDGSSSKPFHVILAKANAVTSSAGGFLSKLFGGAKSSSSFGSFLSGALQGAFAGGGDFVANRPMLVGEHGPEIMTPRSAGSIIPNHQAFGSSHTINIDARGSTDPAAVHNAVHQAMGAYLPMMPGVAVQSVKNNNSRVPSHKRI